MAWSCYLNGFQSFVSYVFVIVECDSLNESLQAWHNVSEELIRISNQANIKKEEKPLKCVIFYSWESKNNVEVPTIDKQKGGKKALEYVALRYSERICEIDAAGCKQTVTAVKHLLQNVSKVQTFQLQQF